MAMEFLPRPQRAARRPGTFALTPHTRVVLGPGTSPGALLYARMLQNALQTYAGLTPALGRGAAAPGDIALTIDPARAASRYVLAVEPGGITLSAGDDEALCNGVQTLIQYTCLLYTSPGHSGYLP